MRRCSDPRRQGCQGRWRQDACPTMGHETARRTCGKLLRHGRAYPVCPGPPCHGAGGLCRWGRKPCGRTDCRNRSGTAGRPAGPGSPKGSVENGVWSWPAHSMDPITDGDHTGQWLERVMAAGHGTARSRLPGMRQWTLCAGAACLSSRVAKEAWALQVPSRFRRPVVQASSSAISASRAGSWMPHSRRAAWVLRAYSRLLPRQPVHSRSRRSTSLRGPGR